MHLSSRLLPSCYLSLCLSVLVCVYLWSEGCMFPLQRARFSVYLPTCSPIWWVRSCAFFLPLYIPSLSSCMCCASASAACLSVPLWISCTDRWLEDIPGSKLLGCCRECPLLPHFPAHDSGLQNTHTCCQACACTRCTHTHTHTHLLACTKMKCPGGIMGLRGQGVNHMCMREGLFDVHGCFSSRRG